MNLDEGSQNSLGFSDTNGSSNFGRITKPCDCQKKKTCRIEDVAVLADHRVKLKESKTKDKYLDFTRELKKISNMKVMMIPIVIGVLSTVTKKKNGTGTGGHGNKRTSGDYPNYSIVEISWNTGNNPGDLRRLVVIQTSVKNNQLTLVWKLEME